MDILLYRSDTDWNLSCQTFIQASSIFSELNESNIQYVRAKVKLLSSLSSEYFSE